MKTYIRYIIILAAAALALACSKTQDGLIEQPREIAICTDVDDTKALLSNDTFRANGNRIMVYDIYKADASSASQVFIEAFAGPDVASDSPMHAPGLTWPFEDLEGNPVTYTWPPIGTHRFFGWLAKDNNMSKGAPEDLFGKNFKFDKSNNKLLIPATALTSQSPQFDFLYSDIITRDMTNNPDYGNIQLAFKHLFTAFSIGATNNMDSDITINEFKVVGLSNKTNVVVDFSGSKVGLAYGEYSQSYADDSKVFKQNAAEHTIGKRGSGKNVVKDIFTGSTANDYTLVWPQAVSQVHSSQEPVETDGMITYPDDWKMYIKYTSDGATVDKWLNFPDVAWEAGKKYHFDVKFADKYIDISFTVADWDHQTQVVDYEADAVVVNKDHRLLWREDTCRMDPEKGYAYVQNGMPVRGRFQFDAPLGGSWMATLTGDIDAFTLTPESGIIDGNTANIAITPKPEAMEMKRDLKVQVRFAVRRTDGRTIIADDMIQPENAEDESVKYTIILPAN